VEHPACRSRAGTLDARRIVMRIFRDRLDAGRRLARLLVRYRAAQPLLFALPRGGVPVGYEIARALELPLDVFVVRKIGAPLHRELGVGALAETGDLHLHGDSLAALGLTVDDLADIVEQERREITRRVGLYRGARPLPDVRDRTVVIIDDGIATGGTARAAVRALRRLGTSRIVLAAPVVARETAWMLRGEVDDCVFIIDPTDLWSIGEWYQDFEQVEDDAVLAWLARTRNEPTRPASAA
jgi:predicted phosphoribosyltransferase